MLSLYRVPLNEIQSVWKLYADRDAAIKATLSYISVKYDIMMRKFHVMWNKKKIFVTRVKRLSVILPLAASPRYFYQVRGTKYYT